MNYFKNFLIIMPLVLQISETSSTERTLQLIETEAILNFVSTSEDNVPKAFQPIHCHNNGDSQGKPKWEYICFSIDESVDSSADKDSSRETTSADGQRNIYFPADGRQPTSEEAGIFSGAREMDPKINARITSWYMQMFGYKKGARSVPGFGIGGRDIMTVATDNSDFFWEHFEKIASDPVGRVLLYRILIEINRQNADGIGLPEYDGKNRLLGNKKRENYLKEYRGLRDKCRSINIEVLPPTRNDLRDPFFSMGAPRRKIGFYTDGASVQIIVPQDLELGKSFLSIPSDGELITVEDYYRPDIFLFHEMLHWFHYLRYPERYLSENVVDMDNLEDYRFSLFCFFYPNADEECHNLWTMGNSVKSWYAAEEVRNILGAPDYDSEQQSKFLGGINYDKNGYHKFLNGDDISENAYRLSRSTHESPIKMRFGHRDYALTARVNRLEPFSMEESELNGESTLKSRIMLAHTIASCCYHDITGSWKKGWDLKPGEAIGKEKRRMVVYRPPRIPML